MLFSLLFNLLFISFSNGNNNFISLSEELVEANLGYQRRQIIKLLIGNPPQKIQVKLSTAICGLWILDKNKFNHGFDLTQSSTFEALGITSKIDFARGMKIYSIISYKVIILHLHFKKEYVSLQNRTYGKFTVIHLLI